MLLFFTIVAGLLFSVMNYYRGVFSLAITEIIVVLISFWIYFRVVRAKSLKEFKLFSLVYIILFLSVAMVAFSLEGVSITIFCWALTIPLLSYLLLGVKKGFVITAVFYSVSLFIFVYKHSTHPVFQEKVAYANILISALLCWSISHFYEKSNVVAKTKLRKMAVYDHLTGLLNRSVMHGLFAKIQRKAAMANKILGVVIFDLDRFKSINDTYGHATGDDVLIQFAEIIKSNIEESDMAFRLGGEEFSIIVQTNNHSEVFEIAESIRKATESIKYEGLQKNNPITVSAGLVTSFPEGAELSPMMQNADNYLYTAKSSGRNTIIKSISAAAGVL